MADHHADVSALELIGQAPARMLEVEWYPGRTGLGDTDDPDDSVDAGDGQQPDMVARPEAVSYQP